MRNLKIVIVVSFLVGAAFALGRSSGAAKVQELHEERSIYIIDHSIPSDLKNSEIEFILFGHSQE